LNYELIDLDNLQRVTQNPIAFYFPIHRVIQWADTEATQPAAGGRMGLCTDPFDKRNGYPIDHR